MKNLNKFTKAELINKYTKLENLNHQNSNQTQTQSKYHSILKIIDKIQLFKSLIIKITLIGLIIKWIKKYSFVRKFWHIFSLIGSSLLGFSLIDIYSLDIISWIKDTSIYRWYSDLMNWSKNEIKSTEIKDISSIPRTNSNETEINSNNRQNNRSIIEKIINKEPEVLSKEEFNSLDESNNHNYKYYIIVGSIIIISGIVYYYWNDIRPAAGDAGNTIIDKIRSFRSWFNSDSSNINNNNTGNNTVNIPTNINPDIQLVDNNPPSSSNIQAVDNSSNVRSVLTSASLENLNEQAESSWSEGISSPDSDRTVTPASISDSNATSSSSSSSSAGSSINTLNQASNLIKNSWRVRLSKDVNDKMNFIESCINSDKYFDETIKLADYYAYIINEYNIEVGVYNYMKNSNNNTIETLNAMKESLFYFRDWISEYHNKILTDSTVTIEVGSIQDSPKILAKNISN